MRFVSFAWRVLAVAFGLVMVVAGMAGSPGFGGASDTASVRGGVAALVFFGLVPIAVVVVPLLPARWLDPG